MKYSLCIHPIAAPSTMVELPHTRLVLLCWQDAVSALHNPSPSPRANVCASAPTISSISGFSFPVYLYIVHRLIQLEWSLNPTEDIPNFMHIIKRAGSWEAEGMWAIVGESSGILEHWGSWVRFHSLVSFLWLSVTPVSKCDYVFYKALGPCCKLWAPLNRVFLWMGVCMDLHIYTHLSKWLIAGVGGRTQPLASINQSTRNLAPRKLKQRDQENHFKTDALPFVKGRKTNRKVVSYQVTVEVWGWQQTKGAALTVTKILLL